MELFSVWKTKEMVFLKMNSDVLERSSLLIAEGTQVRRFDAELLEPDAYPGYPAIFYL